MPQVAANVGPGWEDVLGKLAGAIAAAGPATWDGCMEPGTASAGQTGTAVWQQKAAV